ncbi:MAG: hypothetical protein HQL39_09515 [Alphaproteobacteria bacterium]|nr:hypothetical protein [Alphaproteobacteria bacterium]
MNAQARIVSPDTPEERQAVITLRSAKEVAAELEVWRERLRLAEGDGQRERQVKEALFEASERMCNLMALAVYQISSSVETEFRRHLQAGLDELRGRLQEMGVGLMVEKIRRIGDRADGVLKGAPYPLGLATRLQGTLSTLKTNLNALGGLENLPQAERAMVQSTGKAVDRLVDLEDKLGILASLDTEGRFARV